MIKRTIASKEKISFYNVDADKPSDKFIKQEWGGLILRGSTIVGLEILKMIPGEKEERPVNDLAYILVEYGFAENEEVYNGKG